MPMNQTNSRSFMQAQSAELWEPWQPSPNEKPNRLFRRYFSKGADLLRYSSVHLNKVVRQLNERLCNSPEIEIRRSGFKPVLR